MRSYVQGLAIKFELKDGIFNRNLDARPKVQYEIPQTYSVAKVTLLYGF